MKRIKTVILSYGLSGKVFQAPFLKFHEGFELLGSWERSKKLIGDDYPECKSYNSLEEILADDVVELVVVNTPIYTHYEYTKKVLEAGKHALVEKAFTCTGAEAEELYRLATAKGVKLIVYQNRRWDSDFKTVRKVIDEGLLGEIVECEFRFDRYNPVLSVKTHKESASEGSGILKDLGPHVIDQAVCLFGKPDAVYADLRCTRPGSEINDMVNILLFYGEKKRVRLNAGLYYREAVPSYAVHGTLGSFLKVRGDVQEDELKQGRKPCKEGFAEPDGLEGTLHTLINERLVVQQIPTLKGNYLELFEEVYQSIANHKQLPILPEQAITVMKIIDAAAKSNQLKKVIDL